MCRKRTSRVPSCAASCDAGLAAARGPQALRRAASYHARPLAWLNGGCAHTIGVAMTTLAPRAAKRKPALGAARRCIKAPLALPTSGAWRVRCPSAPSASCFPTSCPSSLLCSSCRSSWTAAACSRACSSSFFFLAAARVVSSVPVTSLAHCPHERDMSASNNPLSAAGGPSFTLSEHQPAYKESLCA